MDAWRILFSDIVTPLSLPFAFDKPKVQKDRRNQQVFFPLTTQEEKVVISHDMTGQLHEFCTANKIEMDVLLMGIFAIILSHYSGEANIHFCIRRFKEIKPLGPGNNTNILPAKFFIEPEQLLTTLLFRIKEALQDTQHIAQVSLSQIRSEIRGKGDTDLFDIAFSYEKQCPESMIGSDNGMPSSQQIRLLNRTPFLFFSVSAAQINCLYP